MYQYFISYIATWYPMFRLCHNLAGYSPISSMRAVMSEEIMEIFLSI